jgi:hypothetical protein
LGPLPAECCLGLQLRYADICVGRASQVDHIVQPEAGGSDLDNLRAPCVRCHARRTGRQGRWPSGALPDDLEAAATNLSPIALVTSSRRLSASPTFAG